MILEHRFGHIDADGRRRRAWIASLAPLFDVSTDVDMVVPPTAFHRYRHLGEMVLADYETPAQEIERTEGRVLAQGLDHLVLRSQASGRVRVTADGGTGEAGPGDLLVLDLSRPVRIEMQPLSGIGLVLPRRLLAEHGDDLSDWHGRILSGSGDPVVPMLTDHLHHLARCAAHASPDLIDRLASATSILCKALVTAAGGAARPGKRPARAVAPDLAMRRFIDEHLVDVDVPTLTARFGVSRTPLYRMFAREGGVHAHIRDRRLAGAMRRLRQGDGPRPKIASLARDCGFRDDLVFTRAFRRKYGVNPRDVVPGQQASGTAWPDDAPLLGWLRDL